MVSFLMNSIDVLAQICGYLTWKARRNFLAVNRLWLSAAYKCCTDEGYITRIGTHNSLITYQMKINDLRIYWRRAVCGICWKFGRNTKYWRCAECTTRTVCNICKEKYGKTGGLTNRGSKFYYCISGCLIHCEHCNDLVRVNMFGLDTIEGVLCGYCAT